MELIKFILVTISTLLISATITAEYVRPLPRNTLNIQWPWDSKSHSYPQQVHISLAGDKHMRITWITEDKHSSSFVEYGTLPGRYDSMAEGECTSYNYLLYSSGKIHHTVIGPLEHDTVYFYRCGGQGPEFQLKTPPAQYPITFAVAGDLGQTGWTKSTLDHIDQCKYDVYLLPGDLSYADCMQHLWDSFGRLVEPLASARPWMVTEGNHEEENILFLTDEFVSYNSRWKMPFEESGSTSNLYYSFEVAGVHVIMLGSYADYDESSEQYTWLMKRVYNGRLDRCGAVHITIGDGGNREGLAHR
uniref:Purple acid phosphatase n=1 Tax=Cicer arietinum TaxID=3827 RepID=A0A3Q7YC85_CICAR|nr:purple acid phosphatase 18-like isoform X3 [Cicer arietinum]